MPSDTNLQLRDLVIGNPCEGQYVRRPYLETDLGPAILASKLCQPA